MSKSTPGPWTWGKRYDGLYGPNSVPVLEYGAYENMWLPDYRPEGPANARLIAAAPDLLAACVQAYGDLIEGREVDIEKLDDAIAKAEGRP